MDERTTVVDIALRMDLSAVRQDMEAVPDIEETQ
jgi:hypothetical protein